MTGYVGEDCDKCGFPLYEELVEVGTWSEYVCDNCDDDCSF